jgi:hypothetical protein
MNCNRLGADRFPPEFGFRFTGDFAARSHGDQKKRSFPPFWFRKPFIGVHLQVSLPN